MAHKLAREDALLRPIDVHLTGNPSIEQQGYVALLGVLHRMFNIGAVAVDDRKWKATFDFVILMNRTVNTAVVTFCRMLSFRRRQCG
jgi:hypothetical protein